MLVKVVRRISYPFVGYLFLLLAFALLGLFVVALAYRSSWAALAGVALVGSLVAAVVGFRAGAVKLAQSRKVGDPRHNVSIFSEPLSQEQVDQYYVNYRGCQRVPSRQLALRASRPNQRKRPEAACRVSCRHDPVVGRSYDVVIGTVGGKTLERASASDRRLDPIASVRPAVDVLNQALGVRAEDRG